MLIYYILTGLGGAIGAISRVAASQLFPENIYGIPAQILFINVLGCFFMGALTEGAALYFAISDNMKYFLISGFLGGFTTFSSFALEVGALTEKNDYYLAIIYILASVTLSLICFFSAVKLVRII